MKKTNKKINFPVLKGGSYNDLERLLADSLNLYAHGTMVSRGELHYEDYLILFKDYIGAYNLSSKDAMANLHKIKLYSMRIDKEMNSTLSKFEYLH